MQQDEIVEEIHRIRGAHAKSFNYDLDAMFADRQKKQAKSGRKIISNQKSLHRPVPKNTLLLGWVRTAHLTANDCGTG